MAAVENTNDVGILSRAIRPELGSLPVEAAEALLATQFAPNDTARMK